MSETQPTGLYPALLAFQRAVGPVKKDASNPAFRTKYASLQSVLDTIEEPLWENGLVLLQRLDGLDGHTIPLLITEIIHAASGEKVESRVAVVCKDPNDPQKLGGALTYYRRYSLLALLGLAPEDDDGNAASKPAPPRQQPAADQPHPAPASTGTNAPQRPESKREMTEDEALLAVVRDHRRSRSGTREAADNYMSKAYTIADLETRYKECRGMADDDRTELYQKHLQRFERQQPRPTPASTGTPAPAANGARPPTSPAINRPVTWTDIWPVAKAMGLQDRPALDEFLAPDDTKAMQPWQILARLREAAAPAAPPPSH